ncbi:MAG: hypothetical protein M3Z06_04485 [Actinomycetota bacterium]|nr:hypothetical protein [Actinomycetota bacterium]
MPLDVRQAVLAGLNSRRIIAGAHADGAGGVCPMVAADVRWQCIDRDSVARAQEAARAWDRYTEATNAWHPATKRQLLALRAMLEASILEQSTSNGMPLSAAIAEHERARSSRRASDARTGTPPTPGLRSRSRQPTGERDRTSELRGRWGWSWTRPVRSYEDYEETLRSLPESDRREALAR